MLMYWIIYKLKLIILYAPFDVSTPESDWSRSFYRVMRGLSFGKSLGFLICFSSSLFLCL
ncbi:uncharacterized protein J3R85_014969 [Psidium guajava]|nr:uncharacterized protein J3R85_014969 [Psidium guajava]